MSDDDMVKQLEDYIVKTAQSGPRFIRLNLDLDLLFDVEDRGMKSIVMYLAEIRSCYGMLRSCHTLEMVEHTMMYLYPEAGRRENPLIVDDEEAFKEQFDPEAYAEQADENGNFSYAQEWSKVKEVYYVVFTRREAMYRVQKYKLDRIESAIKDLRDLIEWERDSETGS